jgi:ABC-type lipoprotein release transport system permease subunit
MARLRRALASEPVEVTPAEVPVELDNLRNIGRLPVLVAAVLGLLAIAALSHVLMTASRRARHEFAILRALGLPRGSTRLVLNAQGTVIGLVGVLVGVPIGIVLGRTGWRLIAERVPLAEVPPFAALAVLVVVPAALVIANALAVLPGRRVSRLRPAEVLHAQ